MQRKTTLAVALVILCVGIVIVVIGHRRLTNPIIQDKSESIDANFLDFVSQKKQLPQRDSEVSLIAVGDIMLSRTVASKIRARGDINYPFLKVSTFLNNADITFGNLENPITDGPEVAPFQMRFRADPGVEQALKNSGFDIVSLANNHTPDYGAKRVVDTLDYLNRVGILAIGAGRDSESANHPAYLTRNGITFAFLGYNDNDYELHPFKA